MMIMIMLIVFVKLLADKSFKPFFPQGPLPDVPIIVNLQHAATSDSVEYNCIVVIIPRSKKN